MNKQDAFELAQQEADRLGRNVSVYEHVGEYGRPGPDIPAKHIYRVTTDRTLPRVWAFIGFAEPTTPTTPTVPQCEARRRSYRGNIDIGADMRCRNNAIPGTTFCRHHSDADVLRRGVPDFSTSDPKGRDNA